MTLNTHSLQEENGEQKLAWLCERIVKERPDILALQEVNQSMDAPAVRPAQVPGLFPCPENTVTLRRDNYALRLARSLEQAGLDVSFTWQASKIGYGRYDEGTALFAIGHRIAGAEAFFISGCTEYENWKNRRVLGIRTDRGGDWFYTVHMGWWSDEAEPFAAQWDRLEKRLASRRRDGRVWLLGDFNSPDAVRGEGYDYIRAAGWQDTYRLAEKKDAGITVEGEIDGWRPTDNTMVGDISSKLPGMRLDHIWCNQPARVRSSRVVCNGSNGPRVSDHFGVLIETPDSEGGETYR